ncbi:MAG: hypothetical protein WBR13_13040 [Allosphingosinicella sp.]
MAEKQPKKRFKPAHYEFKVPEELSVAYATTIHRLHRPGIPKSDFKLALDLLWGEINQGYLPRDGAKVAGEPNTYAFTVHDVRIHLRIDENVPEIVMVRIHPPAGAAPRQ